MWAVGCQVPCEHLNRELQAAPLQIINVIDRIDQSRLARKQNKHREIALLMSKSQMPVIRLLFCALVICHVVLIPSVLS